MPLEEWNELGLSVRGRPQVILTSNEVGPLTCELLPLEPRRTVVIEEAIVVEKDRLRWTGDAEIDVSVLPVFQHQFRGYAGIVIQSVTMEDNLALRWEQRGDLVRVFVPDGHFGSQRIRMTGAKRFSGDVWQTLPTIALVDAVRSEQKLVIEDATFWDVELEGSGNAREPVIRIREDVAAPQDDVVRRIGVFDDGSPERPMRVRASPPRNATRIDSVSQLVFANERPVTLVTLFHVIATEAPAKKIEIFVPRPLQGIQVRPRHYRTTMFPEDEGTAVTVHLPGRGEDEFTLTMRVQIAEPVEETRGEPDRSADERGDAVAAVSMIRALSGQEASRFLVSERQAPVILLPETAVRVSGVALPEWSPDEWSNRVRLQDYECYQLVGPDVQYMPRPNAQRGQVTPLLAENLFWPTPEGGFRATTRIWMSLKEATELRIQLPQGATLNHACSEQGQPLRITQPEATAVIALEPQDAITSFHLFWTGRDGMDGLRLLSFPDQPRLRQVLATLLDDDRTCRTELPEVAAMQVWLIRWQALLAGLQGLTTSVSVDNSLLQNIRDCETEIARLMADDDARMTIEQRELYERLSADWDHRQQQVVIAPEGDSGTGNFAPSTIVDVLTQPGCGVTFLAPEPTEDGPVRFATSSRWVELVPRVLIAAGLVGLIVVVWRNADRLGNLADQLARYPGVSLVAVGCLWWLFLTPSGFGFLVMVSGAGMQCWALTASLWGRSVTGDSGLS